MDNLPGMSDMSKMIAPGKKKKETKKEKKARKKREKELEKQRKKEAKEAKKKKKQKKNKKEEFHTASLKGDGLKAPNHFNKKKSIDPFANTHGGAEMANPFTRNEATPVEKRDKQYDEAIELFGHTHTMTEEDTKPLGAPEPPTKKAVRWKNGPTGNPGRVDDQELQMGREASGSGAALLRPTLGAAKDQSPSPSYSPNAQPLTGSKTLARGILAVPKKYDPENLFATETAVEREIEELEREKKTCMHRLLYCLCGCLKKTDPLDVELGNYKTGSKIGLNQNQSPNQQRTRVKRHV